MHSRMHLCLVQQFVASLSVRISGWQLPEGLILPVRTQHTQTTYQFTHSLPLYIHKRSQTLECVAQASVSVVLMGRTTSGAYTMRKYLCQSSSTRETKTPCSRASRSLCEGIMLHLLGSSIKGALCKNHRFYLHNCKIKGKKWRKITAGSQNPKNAILVRVILPLIKLKLFILNR